MADRAKNSVRRAKVRVFDVLHIVRRHDEAEIGQRFDATARKTSETQSVKPKLTRFFQALNYVRRIPAARDCKNRVPFFGKACELLGENILVGKVVGQRSDQRQVVRQSNRAQALASGGD